MHCGNTRCLSALFTADLVLSTKLGVSHCAVTRYLQRSDVTEMAELCAGIEARLRKWNYGAEWEP
jgi:hypothetical protein